MKKWFLIQILIIFHLITVSQTIVDTTKLWNNFITYYNLWYYGTETIKFTSDTVIEGLNYKKVIRSLEEYPTNWSFYGYIREDTSKRVFYRINGNEPDKIIYDFNIDLYDTVNVYGLQNYEDNWFLNMDYYVYAIDSMMIGDSYRKRYYMAGVEAGVNEWIEGVGGTLGILRNWNGYVGMDGYGLLCFTENDTLKYMDPNFNSCFVATGLENKIDENIDVKIFHDPGNTVSTLKIIGLENGDGVKIDIFNSIGKVIKTKTNITEIPIFHNEILTGIYFYCIYRNSEKIGSGKFIIN